MKSPIFTLWENSKYENFMKYYEIDASDVRKKIFIFAVLLIKAYNSHVISVYI